MFVEVRPIDGSGGVDERRHLAHLLGRADCRARAGVHRVDRAPSSCANVARASSSPARCSISGPK